MSDTWRPTDAGVVQLPSGRLIRARGLRHGELPGPPPDFGLYFLGTLPPATVWESRWVCWPDFRLPKDNADAKSALNEVWHRAARHRVEIACGGGRGRTGTALACLAVIDGVPPDQAVFWVREHYDARAVETPWQRRYVARFTP